MMIQETLSTPVKMECDVLVAGGGIAGISAAIAAAREGKSVILCERMFMLGGLATAGLVTVYLPLCDGYGRQVSFGISEELLRLSVAESPIDSRGYHDWIAHPESEHNENTPRYAVDFNPHLFAINTEKLLLSLGVKILYGTTVVQALAKNGLVEAVICEGKAERFAIRVKAVVDSTGDADVATFADIPTALFKQGNVLAGWYYSVSEQGYKLHMVGACDVPDEDKNGTEGKPLIQRRFQSIETVELSEQTILSHEATHNHYLRMQKTDKTHEPVTIASIPQVRMTRRVDGEYTLDTPEMHTFFADSIGLVSNWKKRGPVYEVPFRTLYSDKVKNVFFAGRCTSCTDAMWDIMRVIPCCAVTGEASGIASALFAECGEVSLLTLQEKLQSRGVVLHEKDLK
ncbi:MAG: FAD-dependent oxidoreductase [Clostridia bacterium]|nr:FAD-dependent oxidoreductase [Clostridia bacterium]